MSGLPKGWVEAKISDLCELVNGKAFKPSDWAKSGLPIVRIQNLNNPSADYNFYQGGVEEKFLIAADQLLFAWSGTPGTSFGAHVWNGGNAVLNQHIFKVNFPNGLIDKHYLKSAINQRLEELIGKAHGGAGLQHVTKGKFEETLVVLPPLAEQKRIVAKLDALNAKSARARTELARIETLVSRYKQAVLSKAFSGELTKGWRGERPDMSEWRTTTIGFECEIRLGKMLDKAKNRGEPARYLRNINVRWGAFDLSDVLLMNMTAEERTKLDIRNGDLLLCEGGEPGRCAVWKHGSTDLSFQKALMRLRPGSQVLPDFLYYAIRWASENNFLTDHFTGTTIKHLPQAALAKVPLTVAPLAEQIEIVRRIESAFSKMDRLAIQAKRALELVGKLDEAILAKAFRGELVPQDDNDEPAEKLLERIRAERAAAPKAKRGRGRKS